VIILFNVLPSSVVLFFHYAQLLDPEHLNQLQKFHLLFMFGFVVNETWFSDPVICEQKKKGIVAKNFNTCLDLL